MGDGIDDGAGEFERRVRLLEYERAAAIPVIEEWMRMPAIPSRPQSQGWITVGMVLELVRTIPELVSEAPERGAQLAELATAIAAGLNDIHPGATGAVCAAAAWRELANARRHQHQYEAALQALDEADRLLDGLLSKAYDQAVLALVRANVYSDMGRTADARRLLRDARVVFEEHGDERLMGECELLAGALHYSDRNYSEAATACRNALDAGRRAGDLRIVASACLGLGVVEAERGATGAAIDALRQALAMFRDLGSRHAMARANWAVALALVSAGSHEAAIPVLRLARKSFLALGLTEEAALAGVKMGEAYLAVGRRAAANRVIHAVADELRGTTRDERAVEALGYLRHLGPAASPEAARHVYSYLVRLRTEPTLVFRPLEE